MAYVLSVFDVTHGLVSAIAVWSDFLRGERKNTEWGVAGAERFLSDLGFTLPSEPVSAEDLAILRVIAEGAERTDLDALAKGSPRVTRKIGAMALLAGRLSDFMASECDVAISADEPPSGKVVKEFASLDAAVEGVAMQYASPAEALGGLVDAGAFNTDQSAPENDYARVLPEHFKPEKMAPEEYDAVGPDADSDDYWKPPPPESHYTELSESVRGL